MTPIYDALVELYGDPLPVPARKPRARAAVKKTTAKTTRARKATK